MSGRVGSGQSALTAHVQPVAYFQHCSAMGVFVFILYISASLQFRVDEEEFLDQLYLKTKATRPHTTSCCSSFRAGSW